MKEPTWVLRDVVAAVQQMLLSEHGGLLGIRDEALLDSALSRPQNLFAYRESVSIFDLAASYSYGLALNHPFIDGNKRVALTVSAIFLEINGYSLNATEAETVITFEHLASGKLTEKQLSTWFHDFTQHS
ncbi:MAG: type II toxin-antitoxin system death-on-curing family toxin [Methylococcales symbiont of Hymedesmia sp. n. MRB-2018]|nr:MAG: type II toxin-antitoxin system death-on-curing family toxin [Methylococcales symbiont of Hymedesmia sp. n. MRB-2018]KAF3984344.1 MAG: type II toxin-antitoxin system death-on-curing family toxin [Methylococcales symbiont of Hymedesmia sp. n. MRB-2018]